MSVLLHERFEMGLGAVGFVLAVASLVQFSGGVVGAVVAERIGLRNTMVLALAVRSAGFALFVPGLRWPWLAVVALVLTCCGAALYLPANKAYLVDGIDEQRRPLLLSTGNAAINAGVALGPLAAGPLVLDASAALFTAVTGLFAALTIGHALLPPETGRPEPHPRHVLSGLPVLPFAVTALSVYLFMFFQHFLAVFALARMPAVLYGAVLAGYSLSVVVFQPLLSARIARISYRRAMVLGFAAMAAGMCTIAIGDPFAIPAGALLISLGEVVLFLKNDLEALARSPRSPAVVFGQQRLASGIGAFASAAIGGQLYGIASGLGHSGLFWLAVAAQCALLPPLAVLLLRKRTTPSGSTT
ncbi:MFS transporter [Saccharopolyspora taberi]|uniref:MFS transporter n=2 Tax=Saccharopolyspora taberi TaxID=60895 RepID=A0ABN3V2G5_9PSEU